MSVHIIKCALEMIALRLELIGATTPDINECWRMFYDSLCNAMEWKMCKFIPFDFGLNQTKHIEKINGEKIIIKCVKKVTEQC